MILAPVRGVLRSIRNTAAAGDNPTPPVDQPAPTQPPAPTPSTSSLLRDASAALQQAVAGYAAATQLVWKLSPHAANDANLAVATSIRDAWTAASDRARAGMALAAAPTVPYRGRDEIADASARFEQVIGTAQQVLDGVISLFQQPDPPAHDDYVAAAQQLRDIMAAQRSDAINLANQCYIAAYNSQGQ